MPSSPTDWTPRGRPAAALCAALAVALAAPARAQEGPCPPTCPGTGIEVYANVSFVGQPDGDIFRLSPPFRLDRSRSDADGFSRGIVDLAAGTLAALATSTGLNGPGVIVQAVDRFTIGGLPAGAPVFVTARMVGTGAGLIPQAAASMQAMIQLGFPGAANDFDLLTLQAGNNAPQNALFPILLTAELSFTATSGTPFIFYQFLRVQSGNGPGNSLDLSHTAHLSFDLPAGATITSTGGFGSVTAVPEPATVVLVAVGLLALAATGARAQLSGSGATRPVRFGISGGAAVPVGDFKDGFQAGALRRDLQTGVAGEGFLEVRAPGVPLGFRASVSYSRFGIGAVRVGGTGAEVGGADGTSEILGGLGNVTLQLPTGPIRPYVLAGVGAFNVRNRFTGLTGTGAAAAPADVSETDFGVNGGAGVRLVLGGVEAFVEGRVANVYTKRERFGNLKSVQYVPVTFGLLF